MSLLITQGLGGPRLVSQGFGLASGVEAQIAATESADVMSAWAGQVTAASIAATESGDVAIIFTAGERLATIAATESADITVIHVAPEGVFEDDPRAFPRLGYPVVSGEHPKFQ